MTGLLCEFCICFKASLRVNIKNSSLSCCIMRQEAYSFALTLLMFRDAGRASAIFVFTTRNLVDPASSHMLVSKIKPCMSQYKSIYGKTANGSLKQF